jgi:hypothetical protein
MPHSRAREDTAQPSRLPEFRDAMLGLTIATVSFLSFSTLAGAVGRSGIGDLAIRCGYFCFETDTVVFIIVIVLLGQLIQNGPPRGARSTSDSASRRRLSRAVATDPPAGRCDC